MGTLFQARHGNPVPGSSHVTGPAVAALRFAYDLLWEPCSRLGSLERAPTDVAYHVRDVMVFAGLWDTLAVENYGEGAEMMMVLIAPQAYYGRRYAMWRDAEGKNLVAVFSESDWMEFCAHTAAE